MKKYILFLLATVTFLSCDIRRKDKIADDVSRRNEEALKDSTSVEIIDSVYNFGKVMDGEKVEYNYRFRNIGNKPLIIIKASASCGCTVPQKPEKPILPGEIGFIKVVFDSKNRIGEAHKSITVVSNANPEFPQLMLTGEVIKQK
ncbi:MAG: DUF1573 domain-containing protein [Ferruginibacter sp.]